MKAFTWPCPWPLLPSVSLQTSPSTSSLEWGALSSSLPPSLYYASQTHPSCPSPTSQLYLPPLSFQFHWAWPRKTQELKRPHQTSLLTQISSSESVSDSPVTPWTVGRQAPLSMGFSRQEYRSGLPCPPPRDLPDPGIKPAFAVSSALMGGCVAIEPPRNFSKMWYRMFHLIPFQPLNLRKESTGGQPSLSRGLSCQVSIMG